MRGQEDDPHPIYVFVPCIDSFYFAVIKKIVGVVCRTEGARGVMADKGRMWGRRGVEAGRGGAFARQVIIDKRVCVLSQKVLASRLCRCRGCPFHRQVAIRAIACP